MSFSHRPPLHQHFERVIWNTFAFVVFGSKDEKCQSVLGHKPGRSAHPCVLQMLPMCFYKEELVSYPVDQGWIPSAVRAVSGPRLHADHRACMCYFLLWLNVYLLLKVCVSGMSLCLLVQGFNPLNSVQRSPWPCHCYHAAIVEFTIEFGKVPAYDSHNLFHFFI